MLPVIILAACNDNKSGQREEDYDVVSPEQAMPDSLDLRRDSVNFGDTERNQQQ